MRRGLKLIVDRGFRDFVGSSPHSLSEAWIETYTIEILLKQKKCSPHSLSEAWIETVKDR